MTFTTKTITLLLNRSHHWVMPVPRYSLLLSGRYRELTSGLKFRYCPWKGTLQSIWSSTLIPIRTTHRPGEFRLWTGIYFLHFICKRKWEVHCDNQPAKLLPKFPCWPLQRTVLRVNQCTVGLFNRLICVRFLCTSSRPVKLVTIIDDCFLLHFSAFLYRPLFAVISQNPGQLASQDFASVV